MIKRETFEEAHIKELQQMSRRDPQLIERSLYALGLLEALSVVGLDFIFKGGSSMLLLLDHPMRLSTDIDIVVAPDTDISRYIEEAAKIFPFLNQEEDIRKGKNNIVKRHYKFTYWSPVMKDDFYILLDVLFEKDNYEEVVTREISNELLLTEGENQQVKMPSIDCLLGDKFTAFAPYTTGIQLRTGKDMEVMKQFYDICTLLEKMSSFENTLNTYKRIAESEINYRGLDISYKESLLDTMKAAIVLAANGKINKDDYEVYKNGTRAVSGHIFAEEYSMPIVSYRAAYVIYMAVCLLTETPYEKLEKYDDYVNKKVTQDEFRGLGIMRKIHPLEYAYIVKADEMLEKYRKK